MQYKSYGVYNDIGELLALCYCFEYAKYIVDGIKKVCPNAIISIRETNIPLNQISHALKINLI